MRPAFIKTLVGEAEKNDSIMILAGDVGFSVLEEFQAKFPDRYINMGIAEQNMVGVAAGLALTGKKVFVYSITPFVTFRCLEQIRNDLCYQNLNVTIVGVGTGYLYGQLGFSHHALDDVGVMKSIPNMTVLCPSTRNEVRSLVKQCIDYKSPTYIRLGKVAGAPDYDSNDGLKSIKIGDINIINSGGGVALLTTGDILSEVYEVYKKLQSNNLNPSLISFPTIKPFNKELIKEIFSSHNIIIIIEENYILTGLGSSILLLNLQSEFNNKILHIAVPEKFISVAGDSNYLRKLVGLDTNSMLKKINEFLDAHYG